MPQDGLLGQFPILRMQPAHQLGQAGREWILRTQGEQDGKTGRKIAFAAQQVRVPDRIMRAGNGERIAQLRTQTRCAGCIALSQ